jgi:hypothetical protein
MKQRVRLALQVAATFAIPAAILFVTLGSHVQGLGPGH